MKKLLLIPAILFQLNVYGQVIPNYNFEIWNNGVNNAPDGWLDHGSAHPGFYPVTRSADFYLGSYSTHLENKVTSTDTTTGILETIGPNNFPNGGMDPCFPINTRYTTLKGFYKFIPQNGDSAQVVTMLYKTGYVHSQGFGNLLAAGWKTIGGATTVWTPFSTINFYYDSPTIIPDSAYISLSASQGMSFYTGTKIPVKGNSAFYVDALNFDTYLTGINNYSKITKHFSLFPSASSGNFGVEFETAKPDYTTIKIFDLNGKEVKNLFTGLLGSGIHKYNFEAIELKSGNYLFVIATGSGYTSEKITIIK